MDKKEFVCRFADGTPMDQSVMSKGRDEGLIFVNGGGWALTEFGRSFLPLPPGDSASCPDDDSYLPRHVKAQAQDTQPTARDVLDAIQMAGVGVANGVSALSIQEGGSHYCGMKIQPVEYIHANKIPFIEGACIKYLSRHREKGGAEDIRKVIHFCKLLLELEYNER